MSKAPPSILTGADARPRIYLRARGDQMQVAGNPNGPWTPVTDFFEAIDDAVGVANAWKHKAVLLWEGSSHDA